jgi:serine/threonine protein kinase
VFDPYKLLEEIGEGGFGVVFMAEQQRPVRRKVALKVLKPGMDTRQVVARFEAERQALAIMDHPNIAKVFNGGYLIHFSRPIPVRVQAGLPAQAQRGDVETLLYDMNAYAEENMRNPLDVELEFAAGGGI